MSVPPKYRKIKDFAKFYYDKPMSVLTIFVGGNHEAMNYLQEQYYGGWVAQNIYFMGYSGVINVNGIRIAGVSGIHSKYDWKKGHFETYPFAGGQIKSAFHTREFEIMKLSLVKDPIDIFVSHDWPTIISNHSNVKILTRIKPHFDKDIRNNWLGSPNLSRLLSNLQPRFWFSAHLHIHWETTIPHLDKYGDIIATTQFLSLDKPIINRGFLDILAITPMNKAKNLEVDWYKRIYSSMKKFCPSKFEVLTDNESEGSLSDNYEDEGEDNSM